MEYVNNMSAMGIGSPMIKDAACRLRESVEKLTVAIEPTVKRLEGNSFVPDPREAAIVIVIGALFSKDTTFHNAPLVSFSVHVANILPPLPPRWEKLRSLMCDDPTSATLEAALVELGDTIASIGLKTCAKECAILQFDNDKFFALLCALVDQLDILHTSHTPSHIATMAVQAAQALVQDELHIAEGLGANTICIADPFAGTGDMMREILRNLAGFFLQKKKDPTLFHEHIQMHLCGNCATPELTSILHMQCAALLQHYGLGFRRGMTMPCFMGDLPRTAIEQSLGFDAHTTAVVCTTLAHDGCTHAFTTQSPLQEDVIAEYTYKQRKYGTDVGLGETDLLQSMAAVHVLLERSHNALGVMVVPRFLLHSSALSDMRRHIVESFEQVWVLDVLHEGQVRNDVCILMLLRSPKVRQKILYSILPGFDCKNVVSITKTHFSHMPQQQICPEHPMYLLLPR